MLFKIRWAFGIAAACLLMMGLGISSCSDEAPPEEDAAPTAAELERGERAETVTPPATFRKISAPVCADGVCPGEFTPPFNIQEIGQSDEHLYVALRYSGPTRTGPAPTASVDFTVLVNGCKVGQATARGAARQATDGASWIEIPIVALPDGEIELRLSGRVGASSISSSVPLVKSGTVVNYLPETQRKHYREVVEVDPSTGFTRRVSFLDEPETECAP